MTVFELSEKLGAKNVCLPCPDREVTCAYTGDLLSWVMGRAPADAAWECLEAARYVSEFGGGKGCVRDIIEQALRAHGKWALHSEGVTCTKDVKSN